MRILTEFHRHARINGINYSASSPLIQQEAAFGLLTATGHSAAPSFLSIELLELLAVQILAFFQQSILTQNLHEKITSYQKVINLRNATYENVNEGVVVLDRDLKITDINPAAEWMLGYASWEAESQAYENILIGTDRLMPALIEAQNGKLTHNIGKASLNRRNGQAFPVLIKVIPVIVDGQVEAIEVFIADISENEQSKALTQQLEHRAVLGDYTAAFAHDVRNPINNISTGIQLLEASMKPDDPDREVIYRMQEDCTRLTHLMESFLAFSRPLELKFETIDVRVFLQRILDRWQPRLARVNVKSVVHFEDGLDRIVGDPRSLENVFTNLISNALEAMTESGDTLAVKAINNHAIQGHPSVEIIVSDNGPGIPTDIMEHIFEPFTTTRKKGTGLGLAITKQIVTAHKGSISVNSFPGGTAFSVRLPAELEKNE
jgi:PAS domain S-box-containing protein